MRTRSTTTLPALILAGGLVIAAAACSPGNPATPGPTATPSPTSVPGTPDPSPTAVTGGSPRIPLVVAGGWDVVAVVTDRSGALAEAASGSATDTMSVRWFESIVENVDDETLEITWVGLPRDEEIEVEVSEDGDTWVIDITQASPPLNSDAEGSDRILVLELDEAVSAEDVEVRFEASNPA